MTPQRNAGHWLVLASALWLPFDGAHARILTPGESATVGPLDVPETWTVPESAALTLLAGSSALGVSVTGGRISTADGASIVGSFNGLFLSSGAQATLVNTDVEGSARGLVIARTGSNTGISTATVKGGSLRGGIYGASVAADGVLTLDGVSVSGGVGAQVSAGTLNANDQSELLGDLRGVLMMKDDRSGPVGGAFLNVDDSRVEGTTGSGIYVDVIGAGKTTDAVIRLSNDSLVRGGNGIALEGVAGTTVDMSVDHSTVDGDIVMADGGRAVVNLSNGAMMNGAVSGSVALGLDTGSVWNVRSDSAVDSLAMSGGTLAFSPAAASPLSLVVRGDLSGEGGVVTLRTTMNEGGPLANQVTDRLLVEGNVTTSGPTVIEVVPNGSGALTDTNQNGIIDANEGISLIQVAGDSRRDAFALRGGYVAAGPWQYTLHAFGPGEIDPSQSALPSGDLNWDYRLGSTIVCDGDCKPPPEDCNTGGECEEGGEGPGPGPGPDEPDPDPEIGREAVVPQLPSYLSAPAALLTYGDTMNDGLRQRLGDIRRGTSHDPVGGEMFARYLGGQLRYQSNLSFQKYGYSFDQQVNALQLGGSLIALDGDNGTLRAGWAVDHGTTRVTPKAVDGNSSAKYRANGIAGWITWQHGSGFWMDGVIGATRYRGDVGTDLRGADVGRIRADGWSMSVEAGMPFALGNEWTVEPRFQLKHQSLDFRNFLDGDGLEVKLGTAKQTSARVGGRLSRTANPVFMPYVGLDLTHTSNGDPRVDVSSEAWDIADRFGSGRVGNSYRVAAGAVSQLGQHVQLYGEGTYQHFVGSYGMRGWAGNVGIRVTF